MCGLLLACCALSARVSLPNSTARTSAKIFTEVGAAVPLPVQGMPRQLWVFAAPDDPDRLIVCTFESDGAYPRATSAAYVSLDGGNAWMRTLLLSQSLWVSETSCAAGRDGHAYFSASASDTSRGGQSHQRGTMEVLRSLDGGISWSEPHRYPFIDWTSLTVVPIAGRSEQVYLFGNIMAAGFGDSGNGEWSVGRGLMAVSRDGVHFTPPIYPSGAAALQLETGAFPISALPDQDGHVVVLFGRRAKGEEDFSYALYFTDGKNYEAVGTIVIPHGIHDVQTLSAQMAIDRSQRFRNRLYVAFPATENDRHIVVLATSDDGGRNWHTRSLLQHDVDVATIERRSSFAGVAVNKDGVLAVEWLPPGGCPLLAISLDGGESVADIVHLGSCREGEDKQLVPSAVKNLLWTLTAYRFRGQSERKGPGFTTFVETAPQWDSKIVSDAAGRFHVFWEEFGEDGKAELLTASVAVHPARPDSPRNFDVSRWQDVSSDAVIDVVRQEFDPYSAVFRMDVSVSNPGEKIPQPAFLEVIGDHSDCGSVEYLNVSERSKDGNAIFRIPGVQSGQNLMPGDHTLPVHLEVRVAGCENNSGGLVKSARVHVKPGTRGYELSPLAVWFHVLAGGKAEAISVVEKP
jgi:hypothetical protein